MVVLLTRGRVATVDDDAPASVINQSWYASVCGDHVYAARRDWSDGVRKNILMHREVVGASATEQVDHINGDTLDNRRCNLRVCTPRQNQQNKKIAKNNKSGFKGVSFHKSNNKWRACICVDRKQTTIGEFETKEEAARAYDQMAIKLFGEYAKTNESMALELIERRRADGEKR